MTTALGAACLIGVAVLSATLAVALLATGPDHEN